MTALVFVMPNRMPNSWGEIFNLATEMHNGIVALAATIPVTMVTAAQMLASKTAFKNAGNTFNSSRNTLRNAYQLSKPAQKALYEWLLTVRVVLARRLGSRLVGGLGGSGLCRSQHCCAEDDRGPHRARVGASELLHR